MSGEIDSETLKRIEETIDVLRGNGKKSSYNYLLVMDTLRSDYNSVNYYKEAVEVAKIIISKINSGGIKYDGRKFGDVAKIMFNCYVDMARSGDFRAFLIAMEWNRTFKRQFYMPRRRVLEHHGVIQAFQDLKDRKYDVLMLNLPPRVGKSTLGLMFLTFMASLYPEKSILGSGHSAGLVDSFYKEISEFITSEEYCYKNIFPELKIVDNSSLYNYIDLDKQKRFHTFSFRSIDSGTTGMVQASNVLYNDDLIKGAEQANSPDRLAKLWSEYTSTVMDRKVEDCMELWIGTPWSLNDPMSITKQKYLKSKNQRIKIISIPCYDENGESNFLYDGDNKFSKEYYNNMEDFEDPVIFSAKYLMDPVERDGRPFSKDQLQFFYEFEKGAEEEATFYVDCAFGGGDYYSMPIAFIDGYNVYIEDVIHSKEGTNVTVPLTCDKIMQYGIKRGGFEENNGGKQLSQLVEAELKRRNYKCYITTYRVPTNKNKLSRIMACQNEIKGISKLENTYKIFFKHESKREGNKMYSDFMKDIYNFSQKISSQGKQHDDSPDAVAGLITNMLEKKSGAVAKFNKSREDYGL
ncbi:MAG: hypothetical protein RR923_03895 [Bacilli bacterium]